MSGEGGACVGSGLLATANSTHIHNRLPKKIPSSNSSWEILGEILQIWGLARKY